MKIQRDEAVRIAEKLIKEQSIPYQSVNAEHVESTRGNHWLVIFENGTDKQLMGANAAFVKVDDETGSASLQPNP